MHDTLLKCPLRLALWAAAIDDHGDRGRFSVTLGREAGRRARGRAGAGSRAQALRCSAHVCVRGANAGTIHRHMRVWAHTSMEGERCC
jgi:hypothetical protein